MLGGKSRRSEAAVSCTFVQVGGGLQLQRAACRFNAEEPQALVFASGLPSSSGGGGGGSSSSSVQASGPNGAKSATAAGMC